MPRSSPATRRAIDSCGEKEELGRRGEPLHAALPALSAGAYRREARGDQGRSMEIKGDRTCAKPEAITTAPTPDSAAWSAASTWGRWDGAVVSTCMQGREVSTRGLFSASRRRGEHMHARQGGPHARPLLRLHAASMPPQSDSLRLYLRLHAAAIRRTQPHSAAIRLHLRFHAAAAACGLFAKGDRGEAVACHYWQKLGHLSRQRFASVPDEARNQMQSRRNQGAWASLAVTAGERTRQPRPRAAAADPPAARARSAPRESRYRGRASAALGVQSRHSH